MIIEKANYIAETERQLSDKRFFYKKHDYDFLPSLVPKIATAFKTMHNDG